MHPLRKLLPGKRSSDEPLVVAAPSKKRSTLACEVCRQKKTKVRHSIEVRKQTAFQANIISVMECGPPVVLVAHERQNASTLRQEIGM